MMGKAFSIQAVERVLPCEAKAAPANSKNINKAINRLNAGFAEQDMCAKKERTKKNPRSRDLGQIHQRRRVEETIVASWATR
ncbi:hypothetical protein DUD43_02780 [Alcaligenes faecalis]|nr:hypothetical protein DUD43_02780 [Alcaligenes faecalis]